MQEAEKPLLLLDVDGVLCPFGMRFIIPDEDPEGFEWVGAHDIYVSKENSRRVRELMEDFEVHWCTGWVEGANEIIGPLHDFPDFPVVDLWGSTLDDPIHWKGEGIRQHVGDKAFAFVDDDIHEDGLAWAAHRNKTIPTLWIKTDPRIGLTDDHVVQLRDWAKEILCPTTGPSES